MVERFNKAAVRAVHQAVFTAHDRGDPAISTEHLLAGVAASHSPAAELLTGMGASPQELRAAMFNLDATALASIGVNEDVLRVEPGVIEWSRKKRHLRFTSAAKQTLEAALRETSGLKHRHIGAEHILLALTSTGGQDPARMILTGLGIDVGSLRQQVLASLK